MMQNPWSRVTKRCLRVTLGVSIFATLSGCGWFGSSSPADMTKARPGAELNVPVSASLPPPPANQQYDPPIAPVDDMRDTPKIGSIVPESGGQKAQIEKQEKEEAERDAQEREAREKAENAEKEAEKDAAGGKQATTAGDKAGGPATQPIAPPPGPVTSTPVPPPSAEPTSATPAAPATPPGNAKPAGR
jgi:hypothetical protein